MRLFVIASTALCLLSNVAFADDIKLEEYIKCKSVTDNAEKLKCYDDLYLDELLTKKDGAKNNWIIDIDKSEIDDTQTVVMFVDSEEPVYTSLFGRSTPSLVFRCQNNKTEVYIQWGAYLGLDTIETITRVDKEKATKKFWGVSTNNKSAFYPSGSIAFIKSLLNKEKLFAQVTPYGENPVKVSFNISGLNEEITPLKTACKW
ncbi:type VI secretion system-associated protein TagO [Providencia rettgeri]